MRIATLTAGAALLFVVSARGAEITTASSAYERTDRDSKFAFHILKAITKKNPAWAIAIVGASHASDAPGCMRALLETKVCYAKLRSSSREDIAVELSASD